MCPRARRRRAHVEGLAEQVIARFGRPAPLGEAASEGATRTPQIRTVPRRRRRLRRLLLFLCKSKQPTWGFCHTRDMGSPCCGSCRQDAARGSETYKRESACKALLGWVVRSLAWMPSGGFGAPSVPPRRHVWVSAFGDPRRAVSALLFSNDNANRVFKVLFPSRRWPLGLHRPHDSRGRGDGHSSAS